MKKVIITSILLCHIYLAYGQEVKGSLHDDKKLNEVQTQKDSVLHLGNEFIISDKSELMPSFYVNPYITPYFNYTNPLGYSNTSVYPLHRNLSYSMTGTSDVWVGITTINTAAFGLHYSKDKFAANVAAEYWKYDFMVGTYKDLVFNANASYDISPWLEVGVYGQYSLMAQRNFKNGSRLPTPMVPVTNFGGYSKVMFNSTFGLQGGIGRQFNPLINRWETTYGFAPVIEFKRKRK